MRGPDEVILEAPHRVSTSFVALHTLRLLYYAPTLPSASRRGVCASPFGGL